MHPVRHVLCLSMGLLLSGPASGSGDIHTSGSFVSDAPGGTPPLVVNSSDLVSNLNADMLDGSHGADFALKTEMPSDGVLEINQDCAVNTGCFAGDDPGFPVSINPLMEPATSFRLTSNLDVSAESTPENVTAISATSIAGLTIDLNGFSIIGPNSCTGFLGSELSCTHISAGIGIGAGVQSSDSVTVKNGFIRGMGGRGVSCSNNCKLFDVHVWFSGRIGAHLGFSSQVLGSSFVRNADTGLLASDGAVVEQVRAEGNAGTGIHVDRASVVKTSTAMLNGGVGIFVDEGTFLTDSVAGRNASHGIDAETAFLRANTSYLNDGAGINMDTDAVAQGTAMWTNGGGNLVGGTQMGDNWCGTMLCP